MLRVLSLFSFFCLFLGGGGEQREEEVMENGTHKVILGERQSAYIFRIY